LIDSHAHVADDSFDADREGVLTRARDAGLEGIVCIGQTAPTSRRAVELCARGFPGLDLCATAGLHPHEAKRFAEEAAALEALAGDARVRAIGETGLDFHYMHSPREAQRESFRWHLGTAVARRKPVVVHVREAHREALEDLRAAGSGAEFVIHCFTGGPDEARQYLDMGGRISFSGILTFRNASGIRDAARLVPDDRLLVETDAPFLAPEPRRGQRCEPAFVAYTAERLASERGQSPARVKDLTAANARGLFFAGSDSAGGSPPVPVS
jgi:TatD DNase family protein